MAADNALSRPGTVQKRIFVIWAKIASYSYIRESVFFLHFFCFFSFFFRKRGLAVSIVMQLVVSLWLQVLLVIRGLKKECDYGYLFAKKQVGVLLYFENINW